MPITQPPIVVTHSKEVIEVVCVVVELFGEDVLIEVEGSDGELNTGADLL